MDQLARGYRRLDGVEEADKLLMAVTLHAATHHPSSTFRAAKRVVVPWWRT
jgi:hypothetical protein